MSKIRGVFPLFFATALGIGNALWIFDPEFRQQRENKDRLAREMEEAKAKTAGVQDQSANAPVAEPATSLHAVKESLSKPPSEPSDSRWPKVTFWGSSKAQDGEPQTKDDKNGGKPGDK